LLTAESSATKNTQIFRAITDSDRIILHKFIYQIIT